MDYLLTLKAGLDIACMLGISRFTRCALPRPFYEQVGVIAALSVVSQLALRAIFNSMSSDSLLDSLKKEIKPPRKLDQENIAPLGFDFAVNAGLTAGAWLVAKRLNYLVPEALPFKKVVPAVALVLTATPVVLTYLSQMLGDSSKQPSTFDPKNVNLT